MAASNDRFLLLCDSRCKVGGELRFILAAFRSGHYCVPPYHNVFVFSFKSEGFISKKSNLKLSIRLAGMLNLFKYSVSTSTLFLSIFVVSIPSKSIKLSTSACSALVPGSIVKKSVSSNPGHTSKQITYFISS